MQNYKKIMKILTTPFLSVIFADEARIRTPEFFRKL